MKKNEKILIAVLVLITIALIVVYAVRKNKENDDVDSGTTPTGTEQQVSTANTTEEEPTENEGETENEVVEEKYVQMLEDGTKYNTSSKLHESKKFDGMEISDLQLTKDNNSSVLLGTIKNVSDTVKGGYPIDVKIVDENQNELVTISYYVMELQPGQEVQLNVSATLDFANAYDFSVTKSKE